MIVVDAYTTNTVNGPLQQQRTHRVLAYGDSLTAGTCGNNYFPYAMDLEQALYEQQRKPPTQNNNDNDSTKDSDTRNIIVRHRGIPGMKVQEMVDNLDDERRGLRSAIQSIRDPSLSIVIILAGTNDLGHELLYHQNNVERAARTIGNNLITLHQMCYDNHIPYTIAIGIPSSGYQYRMADAASVVSLVNAQLQQYASTTTTTATTTNSNNPGATSPIDDKGRSRMIYVELPFEYIPNGENWNSDTLHFSKKGYTVLGEHLVPIVQQIVDQYLS